MILSLEDLTENDRFEVARFTTAFLHQHGLLDPAARDRLLMHFLPVLDLLPAHEEELSEILTGRCASPPLIECCPTSRSARALVIERVVEVLLETLGEAGIDRAADVLVDLELSLDVPPGMISSAVARAKREGRVRREDARKRGASPAPESDYLTPIMIGTALVGGLGGIAAAIAFLHEDAADSLDPLDALAAVSDGFSEAMGFFTDAGLLGHDFDVDDALHGCFGVFEIEIEEGWFEALLDLD